MRKKHILAMTAALLSLALLASLSFASGVSLAAPVIPEAPSAPQAPNIEEILGRPAPEQTEDYDGYLAVGSDRKQAVKYTVNTDGYFRLYTEFSQTENTAAGGTLGKGSGVGKDIQLVIPDNRTVQIQIEDDLIGSGYFYKNIAVEIGNNATVKVCVNGTARNEKSLAAGFTDISVGNNSRLILTSSDKQAFAVNSIRPSGQGGQIWIENAEVRASGQIGNTDTSVVETVTPETYESALSFRDLVLRNTQITGFIDLDIYDEDLSDYGEVEGPYIGGLTENIYFDEVTGNVNRVGGDGLNTAGVIVIKNSDFSTVQGVGSYQQFFGAAGGNDYAAVRESGGFRDIYFVDSSVENYYMRDPELVPDGYDVGFAVIGGNTGHTVDHIYSVQSRLGVELATVMSSLHIALSRPVYAPQHLNISTQVKEQINVSTTGETEYNRMLTALGGVRAAVFDGGIFHARADMYYKDGYDFSQYPLFENGLVTAEESVFFNDCETLIQFQNWRNGVHSDAFSEIAPNLGTYITKRTVKTVASLLKIQDFGPIFSDETNPAGSSWRFESVMLKTKDLKIRNSESAFAGPGVMVKAESVTTTGSELLGTSTQCADPQNPPSVLSTMFDVETLRADENTQLEYWGTETTSPRLNTENPMFSTSLKRALSTFPDSFAIKLPENRYGEEAGADYNGKTGDVVAFDTQSEKSMVLSPCSWDYIGNCVYLVSTKIPVCFGKTDTLSFAGVFREKEYLEDSENTPFWDRNTKSAVDLNDYKNVISLLNGEISDSVRLTSVPCHPQKNDEVYSHQYSTEKTYLTGNKDSLIIEVTNGASSTHFGVRYVVPYAGSVAAGGMFLAGTSDGTAAEPLLSTDYFSDIAFGDTIKTSFFYGLYDSGETAYETSIKKLDQATIKFVDTDVEALESWKAAQDNGISSAYLQVNFQKTNKQITFLPGDGSLMRYNGRGQEPTEMQEYIIDDGYNYDKNDWKDLQYGDQVKAEMQGVWESLSQCETMTGGAGWTPSREPMSFYYLVAPEGMKLSHWEDQNGDVFDLSYYNTHPLRNSYVLTPVFVPQDASATATISVIPEDGSTDLFKIGITDPNTALDMDDVAAPTDRYYSGWILYGGTADRITAPLGGSMFVTANASMSGGTLTGMDYDVTPLRELKLPSGYVGAIIVPNEDVTVLYLPGTFNPDNLIFMDTTGSQIVPENVSCYYTYSGTLKQFILEDAVQMLRENGLFAVLQKYHLFCDEAQQPLSAEEQKATIRQMAEDIAERVPEYAGAMSALGLLDVETTEEQDVNWYENEADWQVSAEEPGKIIAYTGNYHPYLRIPDTINGVPVTAVAQDALSSTTERFAVPSKLYVPKTVTDLGPYAFSVVLSQCNPIVDPENPVFASDNGVLYSKDFKTVYSINAPTEDTPFAIIRPDTTTFSPFALFRANVGGGICYLGTEPVVFEEGSISLFGSTFSMSGFCLREQASGSVQTIMPLMITAKNSSFYQKWYEQIAGEYGAEAADLFTKTYIWQSDAGNLLSDCLNDHPLADVRYYDVYGGESLTVSADTDAEVFLASAPNRYRETPSAKITGGTQGQKIVFTPQLKRGTIEITTTADGKAPDADYVVTLKDTGTQVAEVSVSGAEPFSVENLPCGEYVVTQKSVASGWELCSQSQTASIREDGEIVSVIFQNEKIKEEPLPVVPERTFTLLKTDETGNPLAGCTIAVFDADGKIVAQGTTGADGKFSAVLSEGSYTYQEQTAPVGYKLTQELFPLLLKGGDKSVTLINEQIITTVTIKKLDRATNQPLSGAVFGIYLPGAENASMTVTTDENGIARFFNLPYGDYIVKELKAPDGYVIDEEPTAFTIQAGNDGQLQFEIFNSAVPQTGIQQTWKWFALAGAALLVIAVIPIFGKRRRNKSKT